jgi:hypothetical protein
MAGEEGKLPTDGKAASDVDAFLRKVADVPVRAGGSNRRGRLLFAMDATASRQPTWDTAAQIQGEMFKATDGLGGLEIQLCLYRGFGEFKVSPWVTESAKLLRLMTSISCLAGETQIRKVLSHAINETKKQTVDALVFVGDCVEEDVDLLGARAGELGLLGVPAFMFHEGRNEVGEFGFRQIAKLTNGAYCRFDQSSARTLKDLLSAVAVYAAGGRKALENLARERGGEALRLAHQVKGG